MPTNEADKVKAALQKVADWIEEEYELDNISIYASAKEIRDHILAMIEGIDSIA
jgi:hypothetical protein